MMRAWARSQRRVIACLRAVASSCSEASDTSKSTPRHWAWAALMRRAFDLDVLACPRWGGGLRLIAPLGRGGLLAGALRGGAPSGPAPCFCRKTRGTLVVRAVP